MTRVRAHLERLGERGVAAVGAVVVERGRVDDADPAEEASGRRSAAADARTVYRPGAPSALEQADDPDGIDRCER